MFRSAASCGVEHVECVMVGADNAAMTEQQVGRYSGPSTDVDAENTCGPVGEAYLSAASIKAGCSHCLTGFSQHLCFTATMQSPHRGV